MKLVEVVDDFTNTEFVNNEDKLKHLFRKQASKCHAINLLILRLAKQYPDWWKIEGFDFWQNLPTKEWEVCRLETFPHGTDRWLLPKVGSNTTTREIAKEFRAKYNAMCVAKSSYEEAGGKYKDF